MRTCVTDIAQLGIDICEVDAVLDPAEVGSELCPEVSASTSVK